MPKQDDSNLGSIATLGLEIAVGVSLGVVVGMWIDRKFHSKPWGTLICAMIGLASGLYLLIKTAIRMNKD